MIQPAQEDNTLLLSAFTLTFSHAPTHRLIQTKSIPTKICTLKMPPCAVYMPPTALKLSVAAMKNTDTLYLDVEC